MLKAHSVLHLLEVTKMPVVEQSYVTVLRLGLQKLHVMIQIFLGHIDLLHIIGCMPLSEQLNQHN